MPLHPEKYQAFWSVDLVVEVQSSKIGGVVLVVARLKQQFTLFVFVLELQHELVFGIDHRVNVDDVLNLVCLMNGLANIVRPTYNNDL